MPIEVGLKSHRKEYFDPGHNKECFPLNLDLLVEERSEWAKTMVAAYQKKAVWYFDRQVNIQRFSVGDLVLREVIVATWDPTDGKLLGSYEGPYRVDDCQRQGAYHLKTMEGRALPPPWNAEHLQTFYYVSIL